MSTEGICDRADVMMLHLFPTAGSTVVCAMFPVVVSCSMAPSPSRTCHSRHLLVFIVLCPLPPHVVPVAPHIRVLTLRLSKLAHPIHMLPFVLSQFFHAMSHKLTQLACKTSQMADKEVGKLKRDAKAATRKRMGARRKEKREGKHEETQRVNEAQDKQQQGDRDPKHTPALEASFAPTASHARHVTYDTEHDFPVLSITFSQPPIPLLSLRGCLRDGLFGGRVLARCPR